MTGLSDLLGTTPPPCPTPDAVAVPYAQGPTTSWVAKCGQCGHAVKHDDQRGAERIRDRHNETGGWET